MTRGPAVGGLRGPTTELGWIRPVSGGLESPRFSWAQDGVERPTSRPTCALGVSETRLCVAGRAGVRLGLALRR